MKSHEQRISEFAYQIWESEGKPEGQQARHWEMACKLVQAQALLPEPSPAATGSTAPKVKPPARKASESKAPAKAKTAAATPILVPAGEKPLAAKKPRAARKPPAC